MSCGPTSSDAGGKSGVAGPENILQVSRLDAVLNQAFLRVVEVDLLRQNTLAFDLGNFRSALHCPSQSDR